MKFLRKSGESDLDHPVVFKYGLDNFLNQNRAFIAAHGALAQMPQPKIY